MSDYSLIGPNAARAIETGLAEATWYTSPVPREVMQDLLIRRDGPAIRDTLLWFALLAMSAYAGLQLWGTWWAIIPFAFYGVFYASMSDSRWHESSHGTAFKSDWMNNSLYEFASFLVMREATVWRWSHTRHHSDTIIVGRDPEIAVPRPPSLLELSKAIFDLGVYPRYFERIIVHATGRMYADEKTFIPESDFSKVYLRARIYVLIYAAVITTAILTSSFLPLMFIGLPNLYGSWLMVVYGLTQHAGLAENVLDHRLNCRTVYMNPLNRFCYWNMNFHIEHHMFPLVPYHALSRLHAVVKDDMPKPYRGLFEAYREIIPALLRMRREPGWFVKRELPKPMSPAFIPVMAPVESLTVQDWLELNQSTKLARGQVMRVDHGTRTFAIYHTEAGTWHATDGICTHGKTHLADGLIKGDVIECPKHNGRFRITDGQPVRPPVCKALKRYAIEERSGTMWLQLTSEPE